MPPPLDRRATRQTRSTIPDRLRLSSAGAALLLRSGSRPFPHSEDRAGREEDGSPLPPAIPLVWPPAPGSADTLSPLASVRALPGVRRRPAGTSLSGTDHSDSDSSRKLRAFAPANR